MRFAAGCIREKNASVCSCEQGGTTTASSRVQLLDYSDLSSGWSETYVVELRLRGAEAGAGVASRRDNLSRHLTC